jgi:hypothetical protein
LEPELPTLLAHRRHPVDVAIGGESFAVVDDNHERFSIAVPSLIDHQRSGVVQKLEMEERGRNETF